MGYWCRRETLNQNQRKPAFLTFLLLRSGQLHVWRHQASQFDPPRIGNALPVKWLAVLASQRLTIARNEVCEKCGLIGQTRHELLKISVDFVRMGTENTLEFIVVMDQIAVA